MGCDKIMGTGLLKFCHERIKKTWKLAFLSAVFIGLLVHIYKFTNVLPNWDALHNFYSSQNMVASGRWFLSIACGFSSYFDLPWVNGILSLALMGMTAAILAEVFKMENPVLIVLSSGLLVSFPAITATMAYEFTADGYMLSMVLAALSVSLTRMEYMERAYWKRMVFSSICICLSCGIYQAYASFAFVLAVCYFMTELLENRWEEKRYWKWIAVQLLLYGAALAGYYLIWKLCLAVQGFTASSYQGINNVGVMGISGIISGLMKIARDFVRFFLEWNILEHGITRYSALNILFLLFFAAGLFVAVRKSGMFRRKMHLVLLLLCVAALPVGCFVWYLTSPDVFYHALMLQSVCLLYIFAAVLFERWVCEQKDTIAGTAALVLMAAIIINNSIAANIYYNFMQQSFDTTLAAATELSTRIHLLDDGEVKYVAIYGGLDGYTQEDNFRNDKLRQLGGWKGVSRSILSPLFLSLYTDFDLSYYRMHDLEFPVVENEPGIPAPQDWEFRFPLLGSEAQSELAGTEEFRNMPIWPARDSVKVIGDTVVVKLSEPELPAS